MTAWSGTADSGAADKGFTSTNAPGGGPCAKTLAARPFAPSFVAKPRNEKRRLHAVPAPRQSQRWPAGAERRRHHPATGATAKLKGVRTARRRRSRRRRQERRRREGQTQAVPARASSAAPRSPPAAAPTRSKSRGKAFLAGPYQGAPLSWRSSPPPRPGRSTSARSWFGWRSSSIPKRLRSTPSPIRFRTSSAASSSTSRWSPSTSTEELHPQRDQLLEAGDRRRAEGRRVRPDQPGGLLVLPGLRAAQVNGCENLGFKPKLYLRLFGATRRAKNPKLRAVLAPATAMPISPAPR